MFDNYLLWHWGQFCLQSSQHRRNIELKWLQFFKFLLSSFQVFKRIIFLFLIAVDIIVIIVVLTYYIKLFQIIDKRPLNVGKLFVLFDFFVILYEKIRAKKFVKNIIKNFFSIVHLFTCLYCNSSNCEHELKK